MGSPAMRCYAQWRARLAGAAPLDLGRCDHDGLARHEMLCSVAAEIRRGQAIRGKDPRGGLKIYHRSPRAAFGSKRLVGKRVALRPPLLIGGYVTQSRRIPDPATITPDTPLRFAAPLDPAILNL